MLNVGVQSTRQLMASGISRRELVHRLETGALRRICKGWYAEPEALPDAVAAIAVGGRIGCLSGCKLHGLWTPEHSGLHVMVGEGCIGGHVGDSLVLHATNAAQHPEAVHGLVDCLRQVLRRHDMETALITVESAVNLGKITGVQAREILAGAPMRSNRIGDHFRMGAASGSETRVRLFIQQLNISVMAQVAIGGVGTVDLLVGRSLILELDSAAHHTGENYELDRHRDLRALRLGFRVVRLSFAQIWTGWERTQTVLRAFLQRKDHLREVAPLALPDAG